MISVRSSTQEKPGKKGKTVTFRFYEELNDFLPSGKRKKNFEYQFSGSPTVKDAIEAIGIPHIEVDLILVNGESVSFSHQLSGNENISVYPVFESLDISPINRLREQPLRVTRFILDVHLGKLAKYLRMTGFDTLYEKDYSDADIVKISIEGKRIILTRDLGILKHKTITHGYWIRSQDPFEQIREVVRRFDLVDHFNPFHRCMNCNGLIKEVPKDQVLKELQPNTRQYYSDFYQCIKCNNIYWKGSHYNRMMKFIDVIQKESDE